jgi:lysophospholipase L1-like esterase
MKRAAVIVFLSQLLVAACAIVMAIWVWAPWIGQAGLACLMLDLTAVGSVSLVARGKPLRFGLCVAWVCTAVIWMRMVPTAFPWFAYCAVLAWVVAAAVFLAGCRLAETVARKRWNALAIFWAFAGGLIWLVDSCLRNESAPFYTGLVILFALLILCRIAFALPGFWVQLVNTVQLLLVALPVVDLILRPSYRLDPRPETDVKYYSYTAAKKDPAAFARWWNYYLDQWDLMAAEVFRPDPGSQLRFVLRPNSQGHLFQSLIRINSLGFRGPEISAEKGNAYRIVALGESTTFGCTLRPEDRPWPELLQQMIRERIKPVRPVEVINAGVPAYTLESNLRRLPRDILPLKPDLIISYHGYNTFVMLADGVARSHTTLPPVYRERPLKLLADSEYRLKVLLYGRIQNSKGFSNPPANSHLMETGCALAYQQLIRIAQTNHIKLALANFSMAVNDRSDPDVIEFYRPCFAGVYWQMKENLAHSLLLQNLGEQYPDICLINTQPGLDGEHDKFIDLVHLTQDGRQQLAENIFDGIKGVLEHDLSPSPESRDSHVGPPDQRQ